MKWFQIRLGAALVKKGSFSTVSCFLFPFLLSHFKVVKEPGFLVLSHKSAQMSKVAEIDQLWALHLEVKLSRADMELLSTTLIAEL